MLSDKDAKLYTGCIQHIKTTEKYYVLQFH